MPKLSATGISTYLKNRRIYYWQYKFVHPEHPSTIGIIPKIRTQERYDGDLVFGDVWAQFTHRFYGRMGLDANLELAQRQLQDDTADWLGKKERNQYQEALGNLAVHYYAHFHPADRLKSEVTVETSEFTARLDGWMDGNIIHECKSTTRSSSLTEQLNTLQQSVQSRLYAVITRAAGICYELAFKDAPHVVVRAPIHEYELELVEEWAREFTELREEILSRTSWYCAFERCNYATKRGKTICPYRDLCDGSTDYSDFVPRKLNTIGEANIASNVSQ